MGPRLYSHPHRLPRSREKHRMARSTNANRAPTSRREFLQSGIIAAATCLTEQSRRSVGAEAKPPASAPRSDNHNDPHLHLFVDDEEIETLENLQRTLNRPKKQPTPVLVADRPWEGQRAQAWGSVILEPDGRLRM